MIKNTISFQYFNVMMQYEVMQILNTLIVLIISDNCHSSTQTSSL